jgi:TolB protein
MISLMNFSSYISVILLIGLSACQSNHQSSSSSKQLDTASTEKKPLIVYLNDNELILQSDSISTVKTGEANDVQIMNPAISPNGEQIAYTKISERNDERTVSVINLSNKEAIPLQVPSKNFYGPMWSPSGQHIAINIFKNGTWKIGIIGNNNKGYKMLDSTSSITYYSPTWKGNNQLVAHDIDKLYTLDLEGHIIDSFSLAELIGKDYSLSSSDAFYFSEDGAKIFFNAGSGDELPELMGPSEALYELVLAEKKIKRLSPQGVNVSRIFVNSDDHIYYEGSITPFKVIRLFEINGKGEASLIAKQGSSISVTTNAIRPDKQI